MAIFAYGLFEAGAVRIEKVVIRSLKIPSSVMRIRVVQISDLHIGVIRQGERLKKILSPW